MTHKHHCHYQNIDGLIVHINGDVKTPEVQEAIVKMVRLARNYVEMEILYKEHVLETLGYDDPYRQ